MLIKYSALVSGVSGKLNGSKGYRGRSGDVLSNKVHPKNVNSAAQIGNRSNLRYFAALWATLLISVITQWNDAGAQSTKKNRLGESHKVAGFNLYVMENTRNRFLYNLPWGAATPASSLNTPLAAPPISSAPVLNGNIANPDYTGAGTQTMVVDIPLISTGDVLVLYATPGVSAGKSFVKGKYRPFLVLDAHAAQPAFDIYTAYSVMFGPIVTGKQIFINAEYFSILGSKLSKFKAGAALAQSVK